MPKSSKRPSLERARQRARRQRAALRIERRSVQQQVRLAYAKVPKEAIARG